MSKYKFLRWVVIALMAVPVAMFLESLADTPSVWQQYGASFTALMLASIWFDS